MKKLGAYSLVSVLTFSIGFFAYTLFVKRPLLFEVMPQEQPIVFQPSKQNKEQCRAPYYGLGNGDGVYNPRCFDLQMKLSEAASQGDVKTIRELLRDGATASSQAGDSYPPLYAASTNGQTDAARILLNNGADIDERQPLLGTALIAAVQEGHTDTARLLLSHGADVTLKGDNKIALQIARSLNKQEIVELLEKAETKNK